MGAILGEVIGPNVIGPLGAKATNMCVGAIENSRLDHPKTSPQAAQSSKRCIMRARTRSPSSLAALMPRESRSSRQA